jgi:hypothetical protein
MPETLLLNGTVYQCRVITSVIKMIGLDIPDYWRDEKDANRDAQIATASCTAPLGRRLMLEELRFPYSCGHQRAVRTKR